MPGLGLLDVETTLGGDKMLVEIGGESVPDATPFKGYEMHVGRTSGAGCEHPLLRFADGRSDGAVSASGRVLVATYTASLPMIANEQSGSKSWAAMRLHSITKRMWMRRSTRSPSTSSDISIATQSLPSPPCPRSQRDEGGQQRHSRRLDETSSRIEP